jgi:hypothetical protein
MCYLEEEEEYMPCITRSAGGLPTFWVLVEELRGMPSDIGIPTRIIYMLWRTLSVC